MEIQLNSRIRLNNGAEIPRMGLGTARMTELHTVTNAVTSALRAGYRLVDTSKHYENEAPVGMGIRQSGTPEAEVFLSTKLEREDYGYHAARNGLEGSLQRLGLKKIDLYLIHSPEFDPGARVETWRALTELSRSERLVSVGVSNFEIQHLEELARAALPVPSINQIELHPFNYTQRRELVDYCQQRGIVIMAYSPLGVGEYLTDPRLAEIAARVHQTPAKVLLRWGLQHNFVVIPKASREDHIRENLGAFDFALADDLMQQLDEF